MEAHTLTGSSGNSGNGSLSSQLNDVAVDEAKQNLSQVINSIQKTLGLLHQMHLTVSSYNAATQLSFLQRINTLVMELTSMVQLAEKCKIQVPMEVLKLIDDGKNPDEYTRDVLNGCLLKNQNTKGKSDAFKMLRKNLLDELEQKFPDEVELYRDIRSISSAESKRLAHAQNGDVKVKAET